MESPRLSTAVHPVRPSSWRDFGDVLAMQNVLVRGRRVQILPAQLTFPTTFLEAPPEPSSVRGFLLRMTQKSVSGKRREWALYRPSGRGS
jgi:hypothetical protein